MRSSASLSILLQPLPNATVQFHWKHPRQGCTARARTVLHVWSKRRRAVGWNSAGESSRLLWQTTGKLGGEIWTISGHLYPELQNITCKVYPSAQIVSWLTPNTECLGRWLHKISAYCTSMSMQTITTCRTTTLLTVPTTYRESANPKAPYAKPVTQMLTIQHVCNRLLCPIDWITTTRHSVDCIYYRLRYIRVRNLAKSVYCTMRFKKPKCSWSKVPHSHLGRARLRDHPCALSPKKTKFSILVSQCAALLSYMREGLCKKYTWHTEKQLT